MSISHVHARPFLETAIPDEARAGPDSLARRVWRKARTGRCTLYTPRGVFVQAGREKRQFAGIWDFIVPTRQGSSNEERGRCSLVTIMVTRWE